MLVLLTLQATWYRTKMCWDENKVLCEWVVIELTLDENWCGL